MTDQWYFEKDGSPAGPVSFDELQRLAQTGVLARDVRVWSEGMSDWVAAGTVDRLWSASAPAAMAASAGEPFASAVAVAPRPAAAPLAAEVGLRTAGHGMALASTVDVDKMVGDMRFVGIATIVYGALTCLGVITAIVGVPLIIMGLRLREAAEEFERYARAGDEGALGTALEKQGSYFYIQKIFILISLAFMVLYVVVLFAIIGTAGLAGLSGME